MGHLVDRVARPPHGLSIAETARRAGVSRSTLHRLIAGEVEPSLATLRELAILHGLDLDTRLVPLSDPAASAAARSHLDGIDADEPEVEAWRRRLARVAGDDPVTWVQAAGHASSLLHRVDAVALRGTTAAGRLASAGDAQGGFWALSGLAMASMQDPTLRGPSVLWVDDLDAARRLLDTHTKTASAASANVVVARADASVREQVLTVGSMRYVSPLQLMLDCIGLGGRLEAWAQREVEGWAA